MAFYNLVAFDALKALQARGLAVPEDIALAGFDDDNAAVAATPRLTTVRLPFYEMGRWGVETLTGIREGRPSTPLAEA